MSNRNKFKLGDLVSHKLNGQINRHTGIVMNILSDLDGVEAFRSNRVLWSDFTEFCYSSWELDLISRSGSIEL